MLAPFSPLFVSLRTKHMKFLNLNRCFHQGSRLTNHEKAIWVTKTAPHSRVKRTRTANSNGVFCFKVINICTSTPILLLKQIFSKLHFTQRVYSCSCVLSTHDRLLPQMIPVEQEIPTNPT